MNTNDAALGLWRSTYTRCKKCSSFVYTNDEGECCCRCDYPQLLEQRAALRKQMWLWNLERSRIVEIKPAENFVAANAFSAFNTNDRFRNELLDVTEETDGKPVAIRLEPFATFSETAELERTALSPALFGALAATGRTFICCVRKHAEATLMGLCYQSGAMKLARAEPPEQLLHPHGGYLFASRAA